MFSSSRKTGGADAFENDPPFKSKGTVRTNLCRKLEPELASAPDRGLDAQPVLVPDRGLDELAVKRLECGQGDAGAARPRGSSIGESGGEI
jgi:hypothetical protein